MARRPGIIEALLDEHRLVGWHWRALGAGLSAAFLAAVLLSAEARSFAFGIDTRLLDYWQRLSGPDEPSGEVVVVGVDQRAISEYGRWPWDRTRLAELVTEIANAGAKSIALDFLLTEPDVFADETRLFPVFKQNFAEVLDLRMRNPDADLRKALTAAPVTLAVAGGTRRNFDEDRPGAAGPQVQCADPALMAAAPRPEMHVECLFFPIAPFREVAGGAVTLADNDVDGVVRRGRALAAQPYREESGPERVAFYPAFPVGVLTACADVDPTCPRLAIDEASFTSAEVDAWRGFTLSLTRDEGPPIPPVPMTANFGLWLDFGALNALDAPQAGAEPGPYSTVSAFDVLDWNEAALARLEGRHVVVGLTRLGDVDQHATPLANAAGTPGVVIQALAADNILTGRILAEPAWAKVASTWFAGVMAALALARFLFSNIYALTTLLGLLVAAPIAASFAAFHWGGAVVFAVTPALAALLAGAPVFFGRIAAILRSWLADRDEKNRQLERFDILNRMQEGVLPFDVDFSASGVDSAAVCRASRQVGGDFFEKVELPDGRIFGAVGDVMGKDVNAMVVMVNTRVISGVVAKLYDRSLGEIFREISGHFLRCAPTYWIEEQGGFATLVATRLDPRTGVAEFAAAGADAPVVVTREGEVRPVDLPSVAPLGWLDDPRFHTATMTLNPGDSIVMFTDGVTEAPSPEGEAANIEFGYARAREAVKSAASKSAREILETLDARVADHLAGGEPIDDTTILVMKYEGPPAGAAAKAA